ARGEGAARLLVRAGLSANCTEQDYLLAVPSRSVARGYRA
ncbi:hypothetical protein A2U01_0091803, partial [Trifolium medium]|nr:hypothetical protein [Trifolium medium]